MMRLTKRRAISPVLPFFFVCCVAFALGVFVAMRPQFLHAQTTGVPASVVIRVSNEVDCEGDPQTHVYFDITPPDSAEISVQDGDVLRKFDANQSTEDAGVDGYFGNGTYTATIAAKPGFLISGSAMLHFTVSKTCDGTLPLITPVLPATTSQATTSVVVSPPPPPIETTVVPLLPKNNLLLPETPPTMAPTDATATAILAACTTEVECSALCQKDPASCAGVLRENILTASISSTTIPMSDSALVEKFVSLRSGARAVIDTDKDGITDFDEVNIYHTDPTQADTNHDGIPDGSEILAGMDPITPSGTSTTAGARAIFYEDPKTSRAATTSEFHVTTIVASTTLADSGTSTAITFAGMALPNSFITLYIFSEPIVVVMKTDSSGAWQYTLDKELPDGAHDIYTTITDSGGRIIAKSEPFPFIKVANAITIGAPELAQAQEPPSFFGANSLLLMSGLFLVVLLLAMLIIGMTVKRGVENSPKDPGVG